MLPIQNHIQYISNLFTLVLTIFTLYQISCLPGIYVLASAGS